MSIIILPGKGDRQPERGEGLDRDGPPGNDNYSEGYCTTEFHQPELPRRFDNSMGGPASVCVRCREFIHEYHKKAQLGLVPMGNRILRGDTARGWAPPRQW